ncbi:MAG: chloride channel protein [Streptosporangiaceae bacterium]
MSDPEIPSPGGRPSGSRRTPPWLLAVTTWLRGTRLGLAVMALAVGIGAGFGAVGFRWLIFAFTWLATGHLSFGQQGRVGSVHLPWFGVWFLLLIPVVGGLIYGPLIYLFAREARGHGVPEVMIAVAEHGGRIRPQVTVVKAVASALCIGVGGSVGREGPIVQIGSALASSVGQVVRMSETRLRVLVACGAAAGIAGTFNAPLAGVFFGFELILREFSIDALFPLILAAMVADVVSRQFFGTGPFFPRMPHDLMVHHLPSYLLVAVLGLLAGLIGVGFKTVLYKVEDVCDAVWAGRPEWARPAVGGVVLGLLLLAVPQAYGVGYPVLDKAVAGHYVLWFLVALIAVKMVAASLTIGIGGSGGVFAPSLFIGGVAGTAFGLVVHDVFGAAVGPPAIYGMVAMAAVFASAAQAPLTSIASVVEMTGDFALTLPVMLAAGLAAAVSKKLTHGTIYTTKLLRRGTDIERPKPASVLQQLTAAEAMQPLHANNGAGEPLRAAQAAHTEAGTTGTRAALPGPITHSREPQALFADEILAQALRQLVLYGRDGLPVVSADGRRVTGWITNRNVLRAIGERLDASIAETEQAELAAEWARKNPRDRLHAPRTPLAAYRILEVAIPADSPAVGRAVRDVDWPPGCIAIASTRNRRTVTVTGDTRLAVGDRLTVLAPAPDGEPAEGRAPDIYSERDR